MEKYQIISHIRNEDHCIQTNEAHHEGVALLASKFADEFNMSEWAKVIGALHDKGKEQKTFQQYIRKVSGLDPDIHLEGEHNHAYVGALIAKQLFTQESLLIDNIIMGHHRGLYDDGERRAILQKSIPEEISIPKLEIEFNHLPKCEKKDIHHLIRMLFSCLVDADYLDTESFMQPKQSHFRGNTSSIDSLLVNLLQHLEKLKENAPETEVNKIRNEVQQYCINESQGAPDFYSMTVPTGGGKTLSSILWALLHAKKNNLKRIIIAIPYTSIITQTATVLREIFGDKNVLEHHSNVNFSETGDKESIQRLKLATENWDYPIIVTTNVQLLESLFSNKPSDCRKLHNIAKSVLILDEVQTLPMDFLQPIVDTFDTLKRIFSVSILFTTASQPVLSGKIKNSMGGFNGLPHIHEIISHEANLHERLRRVQLNFDKDKSSHDDIAQRLSEHNRILCIVNTRKDAKEIYTRLPKEGYCFHLSRMMCPEHVNETISEIKRLLKKDENSTIRVVSTQLVEAGVDIDFPVVYRQEAGLDSILQSAGRCNREGQASMATTNVFMLDAPLPRGFITQTNNARKNMTHDYDWFSQSAMTEYFKQLYSRIDDFDKSQIGSLLYREDMQFESASNKFKLIDDVTTSIIVNWKNSLDLVQQLKKEGISYVLMQKLSQYSVNVRRYDFEKLCSYGVVTEIVEGIFMIEDRSFYSNEIGLHTNNHWMEESLIV